jgi:hypothetical protein
MTNEDVEMFVAGLVLDPASNAPIVILKDASGEICLPIWIGLGEATAIASALKKVEIIRPMTHDLLKDVVDALDAKVVRVHVRALENNTFFADIELVIGEAIKLIDARPSDAIALAVRVGASITVAQAVLDQAQVTLVAVNPDEMEEVDVEAKDDESGSQNFANIEKEKWEEILAEMDPDDFKYKM